MGPQARPASITRVPGMRALSLVAIAFTLAACGGGSSSSTNGSSSTTSGTTNYTVGGTISGLTSGSVVLANGSATVTIAAGASTWQFPTSFAAGSSYSVTVQTQPSSELCAVTSGGSGTNTGNVGNVTVACGFGQWTWKGGANTVSAGGVYGTQGSAAASNQPGARYSTSSWTDSSGNLWLFGGVGYDSSGNAGYLNDLWRYSPSTGQWTWINGANVANATGVYGTQGTPAASNQPGARYSTSSWIDPSGNLWLFGGVGYAATGAVGILNDLWRYSPSTNTWTWVSGALAGNASGVYGTQKTAAAGNVPGARYSADAWIDASGNLWLFGGAGYDGAGGVGNLNDLWQFSPSTSAWTWVSGGSGHNASGVYGTQGTAGASNLPGARYAASAWIDSSGNLWVFGGYGYDSVGAAGKLNDLWQYSPSSTQWTWLSGQDAANAIGVYGTLGSAAAGDVPGARQAASSWSDASGNLWLFGGLGYDATGGAGNLNDLWRYTPSTSEWTWISGGSARDASGSYGTQSTAAPGNVVSGRNSVSSWIDSSGDLWLFGGYGYDSTGKFGYLDDLWQYSPSTGS